MHSLPEGGYDEPESTRARLLREAAHEFRRKGYAGSTTREIAAKLGLKKASLYHHIDKKEDLLYEICLDCLATIKREVERAMRAAPTPLDRLHALVLTHVQVGLAQQDAFATLLLDIRYLSDERRDKVMLRHDAYEDLVRTAITTAQEAGALRQDMSPRYLTLMLFGLLNWSAFWYHPGRALTPEALGALFWQQFLNGASAPM